MPREIFKSSSTNGIKFHTSAVKILPCNSHKQTGTEKGKIPKNLKSKSKNRGRKKAA